MSETNGTPARSFDDLDTVSSFEIVLDGFHFRLIEPSVIQLAARGVIPPGLLVGPAARAEGAEALQHVILDEKLQDNLLVTSLLEPRLWAGDPAECPDGMKPLRVIGKYRDALILGLLARLYDTTVVRGAAFRSEQEGNGDARAATGQGVGADAVASVTSASQRVRRGVRAHGRVRS